MKRIAVASTALALTLTIAACAGASDAPTNEPPTADTTATPTEPTVDPTPPIDYEIVGQPGMDGNGGDEITIEVDQLITQEEAEAIMADLQANSHENRGYFVRIDCSTGGTESAANRLANGKFANGDVGAAQTGLEPGTFEVEVREGRQCPVDEPAEATESAAPVESTSEPLEGDVTAELQAAAGEDSAVITSAVIDGSLIVQTTIVDPRGDAGSPEAEQAVRICEAAATLYPDLNVRVQEVDETTFAHNIDGPCIEY